MKDGVAMGSPLSCSLANLFVGHLEQQYLSNNQHSCKFYARFVDDSIAIFESDEIDNFHDFLNSWHPNLKFTVERGNKILPFLDININIEDNVLNTTVYRKPTFTRLMLNAKALCPIVWKDGLINTLLHRAFIVCNTWKAFHDEVIKLNKLFRENGYTDTYICKAVKRFLNKRFTPRSITDENETITYQGLIKIPYVGQESIKLKKRLTKVIKRLNKDVKVRIVFITKKLKNFFPIKDKTPKALRSGVVYEFKCRVDPSTAYIGMTKRHLGQRVKEHRTKLSAIYDHLLECNTCTGAIEEYQIIDTDNNNFQLKIKEAIYIRNRKPVLNKQLQHSGAFFQCRLGR